MATTKPFAGINIALGCIAIIIQICWMVFFGNFRIPPYVIQDTYSFASAGIWGGIALIVSGILTLKLDNVKRKSVLLVASVFAGLCSIIILAMPSATFAALLGGAYNSAHMATLSLLIIFGGLAFINSVALTIKLAV